HLLPPSLAQLPRLQAISIRFDPDFTTDVHRLIAAIEHEDPRGAPAGSAFAPTVRRSPWLFGSLAAVLAALLVVLVITRGMFQVPPIGAAARTPTPTATATTTARAVAGANYLNALAVPSSGWSIDLHCKFLSDGYHDDYTAGAKNTAYACYSPAHAADAVV